MIFGKEFSKKIVFQKPGGSTERREGDRSQEVAVCYLCGGGWMQAFRLFSDVLFMLSQIWLGQTELKGTCTVKCKKNKLSF